jgi:hypothetical protein
MDTEAKETPAPITATDALFGFMAWLTTREKPITLGFTQETCGEAVELITAWMKTNGLPDVSAAYPGNIKHPTA